MENLSEKMSYATSLRHKARQELGPREFPIYLFSRRNPLGFYGNYSVMLFLFLFMFICLNVFFSAKAQKIFNPKRNHIEVSGITTPEVFVGIHGTSTPMHFEDNDFGSVNYCIDKKGDGKLW